MNKLLLFLFLLMPASAMAGDGTLFRSITFSEALKAAKEENKMVFLDCYTSWCIPCHKMSMDVFPQKACGDAMNPRFVSIQIDMEKGEGVDLAKKYTVRSYPTFIILTADGKEINRMVGGSADASEFVKRLEEALLPENALPQLQESYAQSHDMMTGLKLIEAMQANGKDTRTTIREVFDNGQEFERYNDKLFQLMLTAADYRDPLFDHFMEYKLQFDQHIGREVANRLIFDSFRKGMYLVCAGREHDYTTDDVRKAVLLTSMLGMEPGAEVCMVHIALFIMEKDFDGMLDYYNRFVAWLPGNDSFKGIVDGFLAQYKRDMTPDQQTRVVEYFKNMADAHDYEARQANNYLDGFQNKK